MPKKYTFTEEQINEIKNAYEESKNTAQFRKMQCLKLRSENKKELQEIAEITGYHLKYVSQIISKYINHGLESFKKAKRVSKRRYLSFEAEKELLDEFSKEANSGQMLVLDDIRKAYSQKAGKETSKNGIYKVLARHGWRKVMPRSKHPQKASEEAIEAYKKNHRKN